MAKYRSGRIDEEVKRELAAVIRELKDPRIPLMTSVVKVHVTPDLKFAKAYVSIMGDDEAVREAVKGLQSAAGFVRREIGARLALRYTPQFTFVADDSIAHGAHIAKLLREIDTDGGDQSGEDSSILEE
ncbi:30S ribosome-binding factor RbfA [Feifania hominis]|uniref:Ribosome-binding factor A n=1 Tax=Feifania hominis TaxID=2763660 RepID=A0A926HQS0_9FIRM|nr:30S ribosome-binding factor RbfA [Feifania hominis]MBC8536642.1 30S ribosome-binding factor RbfA [Feifania hominis]